MGYITVVKSHVTKPKAGLQTPLLLVVLIGKGDLLTGSTLGEQDNSVLSRCKVIGDQPRFGSAATIASLETHLSGNLPSLLLLVQLLTDAIGNTNDNVRLDGTERDDGGSTRSAGEGSDRLGERSVVRVVTVVPELPVVQVSLEDDQVRGGELNEEIGSLGDQAPEGESGAPEGVALVPVKKRKSRMQRLAPCSCQTSAPARSTHLNLPSFSYCFHRRPITLNMSISSSEASGNKYP